ncbi:MAG: DUF86 domain-containing protein [Thermoplasmata archaeon]|nr:DUF86 domain-containing protein [Thermoplasmata archaeon]
MTGNPQGDRLRLLGILQALTEVQEFTSIGRQAFLESTLHQRAVDRDLEVIRESARHLSVELKDEHPEVGWRILEHLRDSLTQDSAYPDPEELWRIATTALPKVKERLRRVRARAPDASAG